MAKKAGIVKKYRTYGKKNSLFLKIKEAKAKKKL